MILPHYQNMKDNILDGKRLFEEITIPDSFGREFYALSDGSYVRMEHGVATLFGEAYLLKDGVIKKICKTGDSICL